MWGGNYTTNLQASESTWQKYWKPQVGMTYRDWHIMREEASGTWSNCVFLNCDYTYKKGGTAYYKLKSYWEKFDPEILRSSNNWVGNLDFNNLSRNDVKCGEYLEKCEQNFKNLFSSYEYIDLKDVIIFRTLNERNIYYFFQINNNNVLDSKLIKIADQSYLDVLVKETQNRLAIETANKKELEEKKLEVIKKTKDQETKKQLVSSLEKKYENVCNGGLFRKKLTKGTKEYEDCLIKKNEEFEAKLRSQQKEIENKKQVETEKLASMTPDDRRDYICQNKFGFKKNSTKFQDCRFKLFAGEMELEKLQMQKELAQAKLETAKASEAAARATAQLAQSTQARQEALAQAQIQASQMQAAAAAAQAYAIQQQSATDLITSGLSMMSPRSNPSVNLRTTCTYHGRMLSCF